MRKGISEALAVILILSITTVVFGAIALSSSQLLELGKISARDSISIAKDRVGELLSIIYKYNDGSINIILLNYGREKITLEKVMVDGSEVNNYSLYDLNNNPISSSDIPSNKPLKIVINASGGSVQLITKKGNVFDIDV